MKSSSAILLALCLCFSNNASALSFSDFFGPRFNGVQTTRTALAPKNALDSIHRWNAIAINASGLDHTPVAPGELRTFGEQLGPTRASRAMAIVHIAIFDSVNAVLGGYQSYSGIQPVKPPVSLDAAVAQAAHDTLVALYPSQAPAFDSLLADDLAKVSNKNLIPVALGAHWGYCKTFVTQSASQFRVPPPPAMNSTEYATAYAEAKSVGGDGVHTPTVRTPEQSFIGIFWAYDGTPSLCAPPRLYNQITVHIADQMHLGTADLARLLALANAAMADAGMTIWESKYYYDFWRPVTGIRESDLGTGPTGLGDGNASTTGDLTFTPMGAPASNLTGPNFTPPFPSYPSGHGGFGGALFQTLRRFFGTDNIAFTFVSDEFNGVTKDNSGTVRPYMPRSFANLSSAEEENGQSRIYLGIHWSFDKTQAIAQGRNVANYVFDHAFTPVSKK
ncbi:MAG: chloroperoxidase [Verrucomicrobia bacterium]|nr:MAG: chloroperoxidase [Verrucomicrobiota bacterium]